MFGVLCHGVIDVRLVDSIRRSDLSDFLPNLLNAQSHLPFSHRVTQFLRCIRESLRLQHRTATWRGFGKLRRYYRQGTNRRLHPDQPIKAFIRRTTWFKIKNRNYSQMQGREELFERERHREPAAGWHL